VQTLVDNYTGKLARAMAMDAMQQIPILAAALRSAWKAQRNIYLCGNGGSAGNAIYMANDFLYGAGTRFGCRLRVEALSANSAVITCLANDLGYDHILAEQLRVKGNRGDVLIVISGSGNSPNVVKALHTANSLEMGTFAVPGFSGGQCKELAQHPIHFSMDDMQIAVDIQLIIGHIRMQWLRATPPTE
jgi:D-sedoheptulose 7-phosphate isomerase